VGADRSASQCISELPGFFGHGGIFSRLLAKYPQIAERLDLNGRFRLTRLCE